jgi:hypothetical protein
MTAVTAFAAVDEDHTTAGFVGAEGAADAGAAAGVDAAVGVGAGSGVGAAGVTLTALDAPPVPMPLMARSFIW